VPLNQKSRQDAGATREKVTANQRRRVFFTS
jgi:hypothetical protein